MKDKTLRGLLFGASAELQNGKLKNRKVSLEMPALNGEPFRYFEWGRDDGFLMVLIRRIEKLEDRVFELEHPKKKK